MRRSHCREVGWRKEEERSGGNKMGNESVKLEDKILLS